ncbi:MAG: B12-binding domain-containing protein [Candidatus Binatia bacterium]
MGRLQEISESVQRGEGDKVKSLIREALEKQGKPIELLNFGLLKGMEKIGVDFKNHQIYLPEVMFAARAMQAGMEILRPLLSQGDSYLRGKIILGTVQGDLHDIGKNIVGMMLEGTGFEVIDLGVDVPPDAFLEAAQSHQASVIGISAMLTSTMLVMKDVVDLIHSSSLRGEVRVIVGGAPVGERFAQEIGASFFARDASQTVEFMQELYP